jgi:hypothetical protein
MRIALVVQVVLLLSLTSAIPAVADPVTGQSIAPPVDQPAAGTESQEDDERRRQAAALSAANIFDGIGLPLLRISAPIYVQLGERPKLRDQGGSASGDGGGFAPDMGNVGVEVGLNLTDGLVLPGPLADLPLQVNQVPEPTAVWLLAPALLFALRRRLHSRVRRS